MAEYLYGLEIPDLPEGQSRFVARYVFEDADDAQDAADEIHVERGIEPARVIRVRLWRRGEL